MLFSVPDEISSLSGDERGLALSDYIVTLLASIRNAPMTADAESVDEAIRPIFDIDLSNVTVSLCRDDGGTVAVELV
jgi:hypothetical protein